MAWCDAVAGIGPATAEPSRKQARGQPGGAHGQQHRRGIASRHSTSAGRTSASALRRDGDLDNLRARPPAAAPHAPPGRPGCRRSRATTAPPGAHPCGPATGRTRRRGPRCRRTRRRGIPRRPQDGTGARFRCPGSGPTLPRRAAGREHRRARRPASAAARSRNRGRSPAATRAGRRRRGRRAGRGARPCWRPR